MIVQQHRANGDIVYYSSTGEMVAKVWANGSRTYGIPDLVKLVANGEKLKVEYALDFAPQLIYPEEGSV